MSDFPYPVGDVSASGLVPYSPGEVATEMKSRIAGYWRCVHPEFGA
jgi:hypothetical protein